MWRSPVTAILVVSFLVHQVLLFPTDDTSEKSQSAHHRRGRCFSTIWNWLTGKTDRFINENIISVDPDQIRFFLYPNPYNSDDFEEIVYNNVTSLQKARYRFEAPWKILIHGYTMNQFGSFPQNVKNAYLHEYKSKLEKDSQTEGYNILVVDWGPLADPKLQGNLNLFLTYVFAVKNVETVGIRVGEMIQFLRKYGAVQNYGKVHLVGFSLGAHVSGNAGETILNMTGEKVSRITGLDPAGPNFYLELKEISSPKLNKKHAKFVDVYHTNAGEFGTLNVLGHTDFYPNGGGPIQKYCYDLQTKKQGNQSIEEFFEDVGGCSHNRAPFYFAKSIASDQILMVACGCDSYEDFKKDCDCVDVATFGEYCDYRTRGVYYIDVSDEGTFRQF